MGNVIAGKLIDRHLKGLIFASLLLSGGALALLGTGRLALLPFCFSGLLLALWGAGIAIVFVGLQTWLLRSAGAVAQPASAIYVAIFNAAIGTGALVGGQLIATAGLSGMMWLAAGDHGVQYAADRPAENALSRLKAALQNRVFTIQGEDSPCDPGRAQGKNGRRQRIFVIRIFRRQPVNR